MSCIVSQKDIKNRLRNQVKDKFDSALFYSYTDRLVAFIPYDAANPSKNVLYGKVKKIESQLNKEYGADTYGNVVSFEQKPSGVEISIHPTAQLADAMTNQNIRDEVGDDYYMGDEALKEQETQEYNFSKRETYATKKELQKIFQGNGIVKHGKAIQDAISHIRTNENPTVELQKQNKRDSKQIRLDEDEALRAYINSNNLWYEKEFNEENEFIGDNMEQIVYLDPESHSVIKLNSTRFYNSWHEYFNSLLLQNYFFPQTSYELLGFKEVDGLLHSVVKQPFVYGNDSTSLSHIRQFMQFNDFTRVSEFRINDYENKEMGIIIGDLHDDNVFTLDDDLLFIDTVFEVKDKFYEEVPKLDDLNFSARESQIGKRPLTDNYIEYRNYKKAQLDKTKRLLANLNREKRNPRKNASAILAQIKKLNITEANLKQDLESLESNEVELMFHALKSDIKNLNDILDNVDNLNSNYDLGEIRNNLDFLYSFVKGVDLDNNQTDLESLKAFNHPGFAEISLSVDDLNIKYQDTLAEIRDSIIKEDISYINNIENNETITEEDLANMFNSKEDLNWMELNLIGITGASKDDGILPQILKSFLETKVALREAEVKTYQDELNSLVEKLKPGGFDFIFEKTKSGNKTGNIINVISPAFKKSLDRYFKINASEDLDTKQKYVSKVEWLKNNTEVIDFRKLKAVRELYGSLYENHFKFSDAEMDAYETKLKTMLGPMYQDEVDKVLNNLLIFQDQQATFLEDTQNKYRYKNTAKVNPWAFIDTYYSPKPFETINYNAGGVNTESVYSDIQNIRFIPAKEVFVTVTPQGEELYQDSGYYNENFNEIQQDEDKLAYWKLMKEIYSEYINPVYDSDSMSYAKFEQSFLETISSSKGLQKGTKGFKSALHNFKELFYEKGKVYEDRDESQVTKDYYDGSNSQTYKIQKILEQKDLSELVAIAAREKINIGDLSKKEDIAREIALSQTINSFSDKINKVTGALLDMVAVQKAKEDTLPIANLILDAHKLVKDKEGKERIKSITRLSNWIDRVVKNQNEKYRGGTEFLGKDLAKGTVFGKFLEAAGTIPFIKKYVNKKKAYLLSDNEKKILGYLKDLQEKGHSKTQENIFDIDNVKYQTLLTDAGIRYFKVIEDKVTELDEGTYEEAFQENLSNQVEELGLDINTAGFIQGILKVIIIKGLGLNPISGIFNRIEGKNSGIIMDQTGKYWSKGNIHKANNFMAFANFTKFLPERLKPTQLKRVRELEKMKILINDLNLIQDRKNELERQADKSKFDYTSYTNLYQFAVDNPEFKNQGAILLSILMDTKIKNLEGQEVPVFNGKEFSIYNNINDKLVLKDEYRTPENISNWENFDIDEIDATNNQFLLTRNKIKNAISRSQGNYDNLDVIHATKNIYGRIFTLFMKWMPEHFMQRFSSGEGVDLITGEPKLKGRYRYLWENTPALFTSGIATLALSFGLTPVTAIVGAGFTGVVGYKYLRDTFGPNALKEEVNTAQEFVEFTKSILVETLNYPLQLVNSNKTFDNNTYAKSTLSQEEINNLQAISKELAIKITFISLLLAVKKATWDDEDDADSDLRQFHNFADNQINRMVSALSNWTNPKALVSDVQRLAFFKYLWDVGSLLESIATLDTEDGKKMDKLKENAFKASPLPRLLHKPTLPWQDDREYVNGQWQDRLIKNLNSDNEWEAKQQYLNIRAEKRKELRDTYKDKGLERDKLKKAIDKDMKKAFPKKRKGESYKSIMKRINNKNKKS